MKIRALIVDDERLARAVLRAALNDHPNIEVVGEADSVESAAAAVGELAPDVVFLDVSLPDGLGFELLERVPVAAQVVVVTAHDDYALVFSANPTNHEQSSDAAATSRLSSLKSSPGSAAPAHGCVSALEQQAAHAHQPTYRWGRVAVQEDEKSHAT